MCSWKEYGAKQKDAQESNRPPKSLGDMEEIYFYGLAHFGLQVAEDYLRHLHQAFDNLSPPNSAEISMQSAPAYGYCPSPTT